MRLAALVLIGLLLTGCSRPHGPREYSEDVTDVALIKPVAPNSAPAVRGEARQAKAQAPSAEPISPTAAMLAYSYETQIAAPPAGVRSLIARHEAACAAAGLAVCQATGSNITQVGKGEVRASLSLRAEPGWLRKFRGGLPRDADSAGGEVVSSGASSEDLTRQVVDTEAALRAKTVLRDRLQGLLASRPGKLSDLLELEQALAGVQQEIDTIQSELAVMRARVATSAMTITYVSTGIAGRPGAWTPLGDALSDVGGLIAASLGALIRALAVAAPWGLALAAAWFLIRKRLPGRRRKRPPDAAPD